MTKILDHLAKEIEYKKGYLEFYKDRPQCGNAKQMEMELASLIYAKKVVEMAMVDRLDDVETFRSENFEICLWEG